MDTILNIIVLIYEVLYYSLFMKFARKEGEFWRYLLAFILNTIVILMFSSTSLLAYLVFVLLSFISLKYIVKTKTSLYDMLIIIIMLFISVLIQYPIYMIFINVFKKLFYVTIIYEVAKIIVILLLNNKLNEYYVKFNKVWTQNNFYIRYIFSIFVFIYAIISCAFIIKFLL